MKKIALLLLSFILTYNLSQAQQNFGNYTISTPNTIVNSYTSLTANANAGSTSISVANAQMLGGIFTQNLSSGDILYIIQLQGASLNGTPANTSFGQQGLPVDANWGAITNYNNAGNNEFVRVLSVSSNTINLSCGLQNNYTSSGRVLIVRVPVFNNLTINSSADLTGLAWNGTLGGVVSIIVEGNLDIQSGGKISMTNKGFRGGAADNQTDFNCPEVSATSPSRGAEKGEGIAGYQSDYDIYGGRYCRGAAANGGGGGSGWTAGGGGGANGGVPNDWNGKGNPSLANANWAQAWNLESANFANNTSSGGGRGGYTFSSSGQNPLFVPPGDNAWGGDKRNNNGGLGGRPLDYTNNRLFLGGGGGAGDMDDNEGGIGGNGGGLIHLQVFGNITGNGIIESNGQNGEVATGPRPNSPNANFYGKDGAGGAGAGGTIALKYNGNISNNLNIVANGGNGGNQILVRRQLWFGTLSEAEGPGGGGSGGYIISSTALPNALVNGGENGTTNSASLTNFTPNGATRGGIGTKSTFPANQNLVNILINDTAVCAGSNLTLTANVVGTLPIGANIEWFNDSTSNTSIQTGNTLTINNIQNDTVFYVGFCPGYIRKKVEVTITNIQININDTSICSGENISLNVPGFNNYVWQPGNIFNDSTIANPIASPLVSTTITLTAQDNSGCLAVAEFDVTVIQTGTSVFGNDTSICLGDSMFLNFSFPPGTNLTWQPNTNVFQANTNNPALFPDNPTIYILTALLPSGCSITDTLSVNVNPLPSFNFQINGNNVNNIAACPNDVLSLSAIPTTGNPADYDYFWLPTGFPNNNTISISGVNSSVYTLEIENSFGCRSTPQNFTINSPAPIQSIDVDTLNLAECLGDTLTLQANVIGGVAPYTYTWQPNLSNTNVFSTSVQQNFLLITLQVLDACQQFATVDVFFATPAGPTADYNINIGDSCIPTTLNFESFNDNTGTVIWDFSDGNTSNDFSGTNTYTVAGNYNIVYQYTSQGGCVVNDTIYNIVINSQPDASFTLVDGNTFVVGEPITAVLNQTYPDNISVWNDGNNNTFNDSNLVLTYDEVGNYIISRIVISSNTCLDSASITIEIIDQLLIPNVFSPNNDGNNDKFVVKGLPKDNELKIYNRWGSLVFEKDEYANDWNANDIADGTYFYILKSKEEIYKGTVTIIR
jgi:gliding motility-associated-like protein